MSYSCTTRPERLPIIPEPTLILNKGTDDILLGNDAGSVRTYGAHIPPNGNLIYDLSKQRWITANTGTQTYDLLPGGASAIPGSLAIANDIVASGLAAAIASQTTTQIVASNLAANIASQTTADIIASSLSNQIATQVLNTGTRVIDVPVTFGWGPLDHNQTTSIFDLTDAQSFTIPWNWQTLSAANLSQFGQITLTWFDTAAGVNTVGTDVYEIGGDLNNPATIATWETGYISGPCRGGGLRIGFNGTVAPGGTGRIRAQGTLVKSYRLAPIARWMTDASSDRVLINVRQLGVAAGGTSQFVLAAPYDGLVEIHCWIAATAATTSHVRMGWGSDTFYDASVKWDVMYFPQNQGFGAWVSRQVSGGSRRPMWFQFFNGEAAARDFKVWVTCPTMA
jgi:hypothetical protein